MFRAFFALALAFAVSQPSLAANGSLNFEAEATDMVVEARASDVANHKYQLISSVTPVSVVAKGSGIFGNARNSESKVDRRTYNTNGQGTRGDLQISKRGEKFYISEEGVIDEMVPGTGIRIYAEYRYEAEFVFTRGDWNQYLSGQKVEIAYTKEGRKSVEKYLGNLMADETIQGVKQQYPQFAYSYRVHDSEISSDTRVEMDLQTLTTRMPSYEIDFTVDVN